MSEQAVSIILAIAPSIVTILSMIGIVVKLFISLVALKKEVVDLKDLAVVKQKLVEMSEENIKLKEQLNLTLEQIDHVQRVKVSNGKNGKKTV